MSPRMSTAITLNDTTDGPLYPKASGRMEPLEPETYSPMLGGFTISSAIQAAGKMARSLITGQPPQS